MIEYKNHESMPWMFYHCQNKILMNEKCLSNVSPYKVTKVNALHSVSKYNGLCSLISLYKSFNKFQ